MNTHLVRLWLWRASGLHVSPIVRRYSLCAGTPEAATREALRQALGGAHVIVHPPANLATDVHVGVAYAYLGGRPAERFPDHSIRYRVEEISTEVVTERGEVADA